ncbi:hypothetical protein RND71_005005 [Anisodus tanguticus]|uniref:Uncharacterized protein n=1 Tax=Anisodus tanguticus TaxID=243964 RepID=A0AAE1SRL1_9SOLA|nr:hypothetical protein RND71_005005 [Anisodus tanguticus]
MFDFCVWRGDVTGFSPGLSSLRVLSFASLPSFQELFAGIVCKIYASNNVASNLVFTTRFRFSAKLKQHST